MLTDFAKLETFLTVVREKSFSKASSKLGISQPAVTQQMKFIEDYLDTKVVDRKKNGIKLTKEGQLLFNIAKKIEKCVSNSEKDLLKIMNKDVTFIFSTSFDIGNYILPKFLNKLKADIHNNMSIKVCDCIDAINNLVEKKVDIALVETLIPNENVIYRDWIEDELVLFSNQKLPTRVKSNDLLRFKWVCKPQHTQNRDMFKETLEYEDIPNCDDFGITSEETSSTAIIQTILDAPKENEQTVSIISRNAINSLVKNKVLFESRIGSQKMINKLYIAHRKDRKHDAFIENVVDYLIKIK